MSIKNNLNQIRLTAAEILASAVKDYVSKTYIVRGGTTPWGFYYDFIFGNPFSKEMLPLIEERMRQITSQNMEIKIHEMVIKNGIEYLKHHHHFYGAHFAETSPSQLIKIIKIGEFIDYIQGKFLKKSGQLMYFRLLGMVQRPDLIVKGDKKEVVRIFGTAFPDKEGLKGFMREKKKVLESTHQVIGEKLGLFYLKVTRSSNYFEKGELFWTGKGEKLLHGFKEYWRKVYKDHGFELIQTNGRSMGSSHQIFYELSNQTNIAELRAPDIEGEMDPIEGLLTAEHVHYDRAHVFCLKNELNSKINSSLHLLEKIPKMLEINYNLIPTSCGLVKESLKEVFNSKIQQGKETKVELYIEDGFNQIWKGPFFKIKKWGKGYIIELSIFYSIERMIALILESKKKDLSQKKDILIRIMSLNELG